MSINLSGITGTLRQLAAVASVIIGCLQSVPLPNGVRIALVSVGGGLLTVEHYLSGTGANTTTQGSTGPIPPGTTGVAAVDTANVPRAGV